MLESTCECQPLRYAQGRPTLVVWFSVARSSTGQPLGPPRAYLSEARRLPLPNRLRMEREAGSLASRE